MRYVAFLRGINLGKRRVQMSTLRTLFEELGYSKVETFIASGNVIFSTRERDGSKLEKRIAAHLQGALGYDVDTFVRTMEEVIGVASAVPFPKDTSDAVTIHVAFMHDTIGAATARSLAAVRTEVDEFSVTEREFYWLCRIRTSDSKVWTLRDIKALALPASTMRNMSSIRKLVANFSG
jgi:uncharacterized protein (DUF1697 family)